MSERKMDNKTVAPKVAPKTAHKVHATENANIHAHTSHAKAEVKADAKTENKATTVHTAPSADAKADVKTDTKARVTDKKEEKVVKVEKKRKFIQYVKKENKKKSQEARDNMKLIQNKKRIPTFRGRFGKKNIRRKSIAKWDKWRKPHGIDLDRGLQHGFRPKIGYRNANVTRFVHPSGYVEIRVMNVNELANIDPKVNAARIGATVGKRKRNEIVKAANEKGIWVLN